MAGRWTRRPHGGCALRSPMSGRSRSCSRRGASVLMVSHRPANLALADHVIVLEGGRLVKTGPAAELAADPASRTAAMLGRGVRRP